MLFWNGAKKEAFDSECKYEMQPILSTPTQSFKNYGVKEDWLSSKLVCVQMDG